MTSDMLMILGLLIVVIALFISERLPVDVVALIALVAVLVLGLVPPEAALSGFASQATITVAAMFVLSAGLSRSGALHGLSKLFARLRSPAWFTLAVMATLAPLSAFVNNTAAMAVFLPVVLGVAARNKFSASKVLIPMSYAAQMGGVCTLIGTSTNLLVHAIARDLGHPGFAMFDFLGLGLCTMAVGFAYVLLFGRHLLPEHRQAELTQTYELGKYITELRVMPQSPLIGQTVAGAKLFEQYGTFVMELIRGDDHVWSPRAQSLQEGDVLLVRGEWGRILELREEAKLALQPEFVLRDAQLNEADKVLAEAMVAPGSRFIGHTLSELDFHWHYNATVLAVHRRGQIVRARLSDIQLHVGDVLLMHGGAGDMAYLRRNQNLIVLGEREESIEGRRAWPALAIMAAVILTASFGWLPVVSAALLGCVAMLLTGCLDTEEAYEAIDWKVILLLAGVLPLGLALQSSGSAAWIVDSTLGRLDDFGPVVALGVIYLLTAVLTEAMSNNATAVLMAPLAFATASQLGASPTPFLVAVAFAASTSFATPVGYQTNTMIYSIGGYRFADFVRVGAPLNLVFLVTATLLIPQFFPF
ncbi:MAG: SLC13 family permease [Xanthomonadales bacterium]|nr:SLC13 family permease [Xanthomonadales bacterium]